MQIYSALIPVKNTFSKEDFMRTVIQWNQGSPHDRMEGVMWDESSLHLRCRDQKKSLDIDDLPERHVIGARFKKEDEYGVLWTTDFIFHYEERMVAVRLDRETTDATTSFVPRFSPPYFVKLLLKKGYAKDDGNLPITAESLAIDKSHSSLMEQIILKKKRYALPVVYVTKTWAGRYPLNVAQLSDELQGVAHVLKESDPDVGRILKKSCAGENVHHGGIAIYYPSISARDKKINSAKYEGDTLLKKIVSIIYRYGNQQMRDSMYTWEGIQNERLRLKNIDLLKNHQKMEEENRDLYEVFETQLSEYEANIEGLNNKILALTQENQGLRCKLDSMDEVPLLYFGEEEEFYEGEIRDIVLDMLSDCAKIQNPDTRRGHILTDILSANEFSNAQEERRSQIKRLLKGYSNMPGTLRHDLEEFGFSITLEGKHYKLTYYDDPRYVVTMAKSCSDSRAGNNLAAEIGRDML